MFLHCFEWLFSYFRTQCGGLFLLSKLWLISVTQYLLILFAVRGSRTVTDRIPYYCRVKIGTIKSFFMGNYLVIRLIVLIGFLVEQLEKGIRAARNLIN